MMIKYQPYVVYTVYQGSGWNTATYINLTRVSLLSFQEKAKQNVENRPHQPFPRRGPICYAAPLRLPYGVIKYPTTDPI